MLLLLIVIVLFVIVVAIMAEGLGLILGFISLFTHPVNRQNDDNHLR
jgi:hypothetical protein